MLHLWVLVSTVHIPDAVAHLAHRETEAQWYTMTLAGSSLEGTSSMISPSLCLASLSWLYNHVDVCEGLKPHVSFQAVLCFIKCLSGDNKKGRKHAMSITICLRSGSLKTHGRLEQKGAECSWSLGTSSWGLGKRIFFSENLLNFRQDRQKFYSRSLNVTETFENIFILNQEPGPGCKMLPSGETTKTKTKKTIVVFLANISPG